MVDNLHIDPKVPVLIGESLKDFKTYQRAVQATWLSLNEEDQKRLGPKLYRNLLGAKTSVSIFIEQFDPALLTGTDGPAMLLAGLEKSRFQKTGFQEMPRAYETFYEKTVFQTQWFGANGDVSDKDRGCEARPGGCRYRDEDFPERAWVSCTQEQRTFSRRATYGVVPRRGDLRLCEDQSDVEEPISPRNTHWKADGTTSNRTSTTQSTTTISSRIALGTLGC